MLAGNTKQFCSGSLQWRRGEKKNEAGEDRERGFWTDARYCVSGFYSRQAHLGLKGP